MAIADRWWPNRFPMTAYDNAVKNVNARMKSGSSVWKN
jgi:hypothetical protein